MISPQLSLSMLLLLLLLLELLLLMLSSAVFITRLGPDCRLNFCSLADL